MKTSTKERTLEDHIHEINKALTPESAFDIYCKIIKSYGYNQVVYSLMTDHPSLNLPNQHGFVNSYPEDWMKHYFEKNYADLDPVRKNITDNPVPFFWQDLTKSPMLSKNQKIFMNEANDAGVSDGIGISMFGKMGEIAGIGLAKDTYDKGNDYESLSQINLLSQYYHETFKSLIKKPNEVVRLTPREKEILSWASEGKQDFDISCILNISTNTVRYHWKNIFKKLDTYGRIHSTTKAIRLQLIEPRVVKPAKVSSI